MSSETISIKPNNHRIYQCPTDNKPTLINHLIEQNSNMDIVVVCSTNAPELQEKLQNSAIRVIEDRELVKDKELKCELLISYDIPIKAIVYMARVAKATQKAFLLLDKSEQKELHSIEMLLGRAIKQEVVEGFEYPTEVKEKSLETSVKKMSKEEIKGEAKKRYQAKTQDTPKKNSDKSKKEFKAKRDEKPKDDRWAKKKKAPNKFLGKDENGKAIFSGKDGERNHRYDGTSKKKHPAPKAAGRKISIKAIKPKESKES